ncbi:stage III sporulation protein AE [uncultured Clostridium sp.]|uniref:stage III sporulation protein AE n=1 Tax=uncultured Clostridium sp. TaxID=59620 RepID=UPI0026226200|nr:stage III sporulation protein AE [uncultured Clostridium sp.]
MDKKLVRFILSFFIMFSGFSVICLANDTELKDSFESTKQELETDVSIEKFYEYINNMNSEVEMLEGMSAKEYVEKFLETGESPVEISKVLKGVVSFFFKELLVMLKLLTAFIVIALLSSLLECLQDAFDNETVSKVAFFACYALAVMLLTSTFLLGLGIAKDVINNLVGFMGALMPVLIFLLSTAGGITSAVTMDPIVILLVSIVPKIYIDFIFPLILIKFALEFVNNLSDDINLDKMCDFFKYIAAWSQGILLTVFVGIMAIRGISANTIDAVTLKTAKFAVDNFIPVVGKSFSDAITTVAGYSLVLKNAISSVGLVAIIGMMLYPVIKIAMMIFSCRLTEALVQQVANKKLVGAIESLGDAMTMVFACIASISIMFFIVIAIMSSAGGFVVGG